MQLFGLTYGITGITDADLAAAIEAAALAFPKLDAGTLYRETSRGGALSVAAIQHAPEIARPRSYRARKDDVVVLFDGLPVERKGRFAAHDAAALLDHWDELPEALDGQFSALRIDLGADTVECLPDILGIARVFFARLGSGYVVSNSTEAIRALGSLNSPDPLGVSSFLGMGFAAGYRTLIDGIEALQGGRLYTLNRGGLSERPLVTPATLATGTAREKRSPDDLARALVELTRSAADGVAPVECALTGGRDTRVLLALTAAAELDASYYTIGRRGQPDVEIARALAAAFSLPYSVWDPAELDQDIDWRGLTRRFVSQTSGMSSLRQIRDYIDQLAPIEQLGRKMWGGGGEIGRAGGTTLIAFSVNAPGVRASAPLQRLLLEREINTFGGLVTGAAEAVVKRHLREFVRQRRSEGWSRRELPEAFYTWQRVGCSVAIGQRRTADTHDVFSPFCSRDFIEYCFSLSPEERYVEAPHHRILSALSPLLRDMPYDKPWKPQRPRFTSALVIYHALRVAGSHVDFSRVLARRSKSSPDQPGERVASYEESWFEERLTANRELCLSFPSSPLWEYVGRAQLEAALSGPAENRAGRLEGLYRVITAFWYFHGRDT